MIKQKADPYLYIAAELTNLLLGHGIRVVVCFGYGVDIVVNKRLREDHSDLDIKLIHHPKFSREELRALLTDTLTDITGSIWNGRNIERSWIFFKEKNNLKKIDCHLLASQEPFSSNPVRVISRVAKGYTLNLSRSQVRIGNQSIVTLETPTQEEIAAEKVRMFDHYLSKGEEIRKKDFSDLQLLFNNKDFNKKIFIKILAAFFERQRGKSPYHSTKRAQKLFNVITKP